jgi:transcriptional regulator with XRE-family HTH domain
MTDGALFQDLQTKQQRRIRNSPATTSLLARNLARDMTAEQRGDAARKIVVLLASLGLDRAQLAERIGLSRSSTSHWHHGANSISRHNLAVLLDLAAQRAPAARRALAAISSTELPWSREVMSGFEIPAECADSPSSVQGILLPGARCGKIDRMEREASGSGAGFTYADLPVAKVSVTNITNGPRRPRRAGSGLNWGLEGDVYVSGGYSIRRLDQGGWVLRMLIGTVDCSVECRTLVEAFAVAHDLEGGEID